MATSSCARWEHDPIVAHVDNIISANKVYPNVPGVNSWLLGSGEFIIVILFRTLVYQKGSLDGPLSSTDSLMDTMVARSIVAGRHWNRNSLTRVGSII